MGSAKDTDETAGMGFAELGMMGFPVAGRMAGAEHRVTGRKRAAAHAAGGPA